MAKRKGKYTVVFDDPPGVRESAAVGSKKESEGPLAQAFDVINEDSYFGEKTWEKAESRMQETAINKALEKAQLSSADIDCIFAGDLLNQCVGSTYGIRALGMPFIGLFGACSTMAESLAVSSVFLEAGAVTRAVACTSSHFCSAERQFRLPLEYGGQRTPTAQWTVTGSGCIILARDGNGPYVTHATIGKIVDKGIKDANNMGAAMAPAAYETIKAHFQDTGRRPSQYDLIVTGDLGKLGSEILFDLFHKDGMDLNNLTDCGTLIYDLEGQDVHCGGSGCGCSAVVLTGHLLNGMRAGRWKNILFCGTGALLSPTSTQQGESIPCICHAAAISCTK